MTNPENTSFLLHNPKNMEYGYINEPTKLTNIKYFEKDSRVGMLADVEPYIKDNLNLSGEIYKKIILVLIGIKKLENIIFLKTFPVSVQVIFIKNEDAEITDDWYENKYFIGTITKYTN